MKMRSMGRGTLLNVAPFAVVAALAASLALAGFVASPRAVIDPAANASAATTSPSSAPSAAGLKSNDAAEMLRVHNELRAAIGAPAVRADDRVTAAAQHHAEYLARAGAIGHDETAGQPGFTGVSVRDRLAAQAA